MSALLSFLGGSAFRMIWGEVSAFFTSRQNHAQELARMELQGRLDAEQHARNMDAIKLQADLGVKEIRVKAEAAANQIELGAWAQAVADIGKPIGIKWVDAWNAAIRPLLATIATVVLLSEAAVSVSVALKAGTAIVLTAWVVEVICAVLGMYVADRSLTHRGK